MLALSTNCTCYLLPSHLPNSYPLDVHAQYQMYLLIVNFTLSQQLPCRCSRSVPTVPVTCYFHTFLTATLSMLALSTNCTCYCYLHTFPTATLSMFTVSTNCTCYLLLSLLLNSYTLHARFQYQLYLLLIPSHLLNSYTLHARSQYQLYLLLLTFTPSQQLHSPCSFSGPTVPATCYLHTFPTATLSILALCTNCTCYRYLHTFPTATLSMPALSTNCTCYCYLHTFSTATISMLALSTNCSCYLLPSHLPNRYTLNAPSQYQL